MALHGEAFNHSAVNFAAPDHAQYPNYRDVLQSCRTVRVGPGDALFIPEGWWHQVDSGGTTIAVNIWWQSAFSAMLGTHMDAYYARQAIASLLFTEKKRRLASVLPYRTASFVPANPPAPSQSAASHLPAESANMTLPSTTASGAASREPEEASPVTASTTAKARKKRGGKKAAAAKNDPVSEGKKRHQPVSDPGGSRELLKGTETGAQQAGGASNEAIGRVAASLDSFVSPAKVASDDRFDPSNLSSPPTPGLPGLPSTEPTSAAAKEGLGAHGETELSSVPPGTRGLGNSDQTGGKGESQAGETASETMSAAARKRRRVVESLSTEEAQLLQALVLHAGTGSRTGTDSRRNGTDLAGTGGCQHCGSLRSPGTDDERSDGQSGEGAVGVEGGNGSGEEEGEGAQETDTVAGVFATSQAGKLQRVLLAMATAFPRALERLILYGLSPVAAELLTSRFDDFDKLEPREAAAADDPLQVESTAAFFEQFYSVFEDRNAAMGALLDGKEAFAAQALRDVLRDLQGVDDVSAQSGMRKEPVRR